MKAAKDQGPAGEKLNINVSTHETSATKPARLLALQTVADLSDRRLAFFHWREASEALDALQHEVRDYGDEDSNFDPHQEEEIDEKIAKITRHLAHVTAIVTESAERTRAEIKRLAAETAAKVEKGGAS